METATHPETGARMYLAPSGDWVPFETATNPSTGEKLLLNPETEDWEPVAQAGAPAIPQPSMPTARPEVSIPMGLARALTSGLSLGFGDELAGAVAGAGAMWPGGASPGDAYTLARDRSRAASGAFETQHPGAALGAEVTGGLLGGIGTGVAAARAGGKALAPWLAKLPWYSRIPANVALGAAGGATGGAVAGAGHAPTLEQVPGEAALGGGLGAVLGGGIGGVVSGVGAAARGGRELYRSYAEPGVAAARNVDRAIDNARLTTQGPPGDPYTEALARAGAMGPQGTIADIAESTREALETTTQRPGAARDIAMRQLTRRSVNQGEELLERLGPAQKHATVRALQATRKEEASPLYERAFGRGVEHTDELEDVFMTMEDLMPGAWAKAKTFGQAALRNRGELGLDEAALGEARPTLRGWQFVQRRMRSAAETARRAGNNDEAIIIDQTRARLLRELDAQSPEFAEARRLWAGTKQFGDMMEESKRFMTMSAGDFDDVMRGLSPIDREAVRVGAVQAIRDRIENGQFTHDVAKFFRTPAMRKKMTTLLGSAEEAAEFENRIVASTQQQRTYDAVRGGSATARRQAAEKASNDWIGIGMDMAADAALGVPLAGPSAVKRGLRAIGRLGPGSREAAREETAEILLEANPGKRALNRARSQAMLAPTAATPARALDPFIYSVGLPFAASPLVD